jgi:hypothetical protein
MMWCSPLGRNEASQLAGWQLKKSLPCCRRSSQPHASTSSCRLEEVARARDRVAELAVGYFGSLIGFGFLGQIQVSEEKI